MKPTNHPEPSKVVDDLLQELVQGIDDAYTALQDGDHQEYLEVKDQAEKEAKAKLTTMLLEARLDELTLLNNDHSITDRDMAYYIMGRKFDLESEKVDQRDVLMWR